MYLFIAISCTLTCASTIIYVLHWNIVIACIRHQYILGELTLTIHGLGNLICMSDTQGLVDRLVRSHCVQCRGNLGNSLRSLGTLATSVQPALASPLAASTYCYGLFLPVSLQVLQYIGVRVGLICCTPHIWTMVRSTRVPDHSILATVTCFGYFITIWNHVATITEGGKLSLQVFHSAGVEIYHLQMCIGYT